jgi:hypothetical protein
MNKNTIVTAILAIVLWEFRFEILAIVSGLLGLT